MKNLWNGRSPARPPAAARLRADGGAAALAILLLGPLLAPDGARAQGPEPPAPRFVAAGDTTVGSPPADSSSRAPRNSPGVPALAATLDSLGLENFAIGHFDDHEVPMFEDRRYRHPEQVLGRLARATGRPTAVVERALDLPRAYLVPDTAGRPRRVLYPSDRGFPTLPSRPFARSTHRQLDLLVDAEYAYELGQIDQPLQWSLALRWEADAYPWSGARVRASWVTPLHDDFSGFDPIHPDVHRARPGPTMIEQYAWLGRVGLASGTAGLLGGDRWGGSFGLAHPFAGGAALVDVQGDLTGAFALADSGIVYSEPNRFDGYAGVTIRPWWIPGLAMRARVARYLREDRGISGELERRFGDVWVAFRADRTGGFDALGVRVTLPVPPMLRPTRWPIRVLPPPTFTISYRTEATPVGELPSGTASRERFLDGTWAPELADQSPRYRAEREGVRRRPVTPALTPISYSGMTGFVTTPSAEALPEGQVEMGYSRLPKAAAWDHRGTFANEAWYGAVGFLPRTEIGVRWTVIPGLRAFDQFDPGNALVDADRMVSGRVVLIPVRGWRPGLAAGAEDVFGTRRFNATYLVSGVNPSIFGLQTRVSGGYAPRVLSASHRTLDGGFGALELRVARLATPVVEYDSERWNAGLGVHLGPYVHLRVAWFDLKYAALGGGLSLTL